LWFIQIAFDEAHRAKNMIPADNCKASLFGEGVNALQQMLPQARILYVSATGASEPRNMLYMSRLGLWGREGLFRTANEFLTEMGDG